MKDNFKLFKQLPDDCKNEIGSYLPTSSLFKTAMTSKTHWNLFCTKNIKRPGLLDERKKIIEQLSRPH